MTIEQYTEELKQIQSYLEIEVSDNPEEYAERIRTLAVYMARSGQMLADAKRLYNEKMHSEMLQLIRQLTKEHGVSMGVQNALAKACASEEQYLVDWCERVNRSCTHQIEAMRSLLSMEKEQLRIAKTGY